MTPKDIAAKLKFRSALSKTMRDGVTVPCGRSMEREVAIHCAKVKMEKAPRELACSKCAEALSGKKKKGGARR